MDPLTLGSFVFFTALVGILTWWLTRHDRIDTSEGYFLAGRSLTGGFIAGSLLLTNLSTEQLIGLNGSAFLNGISVMAWEVIAGVSLVIMGLVFLPLYLRCGITTIPQFLEIRYDGGTRTITTIIFILAYTLITLPMFLYTGAMGLNGILDMKTILGTSNPTVELWVMVWMVGILGSIYAIFGGLRTVAVSDTLNGFGLLVGGVLISWLGLKAINPEAPLEAITTLREAHPEKFNSLGSRSQEVPFSTLFTGVLLLNLFYWCTNQQIIQRAFAASNLREGQKGVLLAGVLKILAPLILILPGIIAFHLYAADGVRASDAYGTLVRNVLPPSLRGFFAAVVVGAILSSFNSVLNSTATMFSLGVYKQILFPQATDEQVINSGKGFGWVIAIFSMMLAPNLAGQESIFQFLQKMNGLYFIPIFAVVVAGLIHRRVPAWAANIALIAGCSIIGAAYFIPPLEESLKWLPNLHFLGLVFVVLMGFLFISAFLAPRESPWMPSQSSPVDLTPWGPAVPIGLGLIAIVIAIYVYFADTTVLSDPAAAATISEPAR